MIAEEVQDLLADLKRLLESAKDDYAQSRWNNHHYYVTEFNKLLKKAKDTGFGVEIADIKEADHDQEIPTSWVSGTPYHPNMVQSVGAKTRKLREIINAADKLYQEIASKSEPQSAKDSKKAIAIARLQKIVDAIETLKTGPHNSNEFKKWKRDAEITIERIFPKGSRHLEDFTSVNYYPISAYVVGVGKKTNEEEYKTAYIEGLERVRFVLQSMIEEVEIYWEDEPTVPEAPAARTTGEIIELLCNRFYTVTRQLKKRSKNRPSLEITDEYDVQYLIRALLYLFFEDVRPEEWTPSYAGKSSRVDFLLKVEKTVLEIKHARRSLTEKELGDELIIDIRRYQATHPDCESLYCFVYDPEGYIDNPRGMENDLSKVTEGMPVKVIIAPKTH